MTSSNNRRQGGDDATDDDEAELFRRAVEGTRPLRQRPVAETSVKPRPRARFRRDDDRAVLAESLQDDIDDMEIGAGERLQFRRPEVGQRTLRRLARGAYSVQAELDLHGMTATEAEDALRDFIDASVHARHRCVRIVHGKGLGSGHAGPVLKVRVNRWLRRWRNVLAFSSARQVDGGTGAVYVLLRQR